METDEEGSTASASVSGSDVVSGTRRRICWPWSHGGTPRKVGGASSFRLARGCGQSLLNGKLLRSLNSHAAAVVCLNWEEDAQVNRDTSGNSLAFEDRTTRYFPPAPRVPRMPGLVPRETDLTDDGQDSFVELSNSSKQCFNILCS
ncbi:anaphase-promoting complex subunit 4-like [Syzygium oleosum]|uniref:anaphase-promoting complex subunit 4-like n=1 Tax=Syzygium oleosum TaxID=219896 RepID=UPI0024BBDAAD|nr:anaphase-promoting complex subunit 4-like [Syzygium oleosum]